MEPDPEGIPSKPRGLYLHHCKKGLSQLIDTASNHVLREQKMYQPRYSKMVRPSREQLQAGSIVFIRRKRTQHKEMTHKLSPTADKPYEVSSMVNTTVTIKIGPNIKRISRN